MGDPVEAAYLEGKITAERRAHWRRQMAKKPKATRRTLAGLEAVLPPPDDEEDMDGYEAFAEGRSPAYPSSQAPATVATGPSEYPQEWLTQTQRRGPSGSITFEDAQTAAQAGAAGLV